VLNWLRRRVRRAVVKAAREDLETFVETLRGYSGQELGMLVAIAAALRISLRDAGELPDELLQVTADPRQPAIQQAMANLVLSFRTPAQAVGAIVWLHTLRALSIPELRYLGRQMWQQLQRGQSLAPVALQELQAISDSPPPAGALAACSYVPTDLDPGELPRA
jgi:hypothetical protein